MGSIGLTTSLTKFFEAVTPDGWLGLVGSFIGIFLAYLLGDYHGNRREKQRQNDLIEYRRSVLPYFLSELGVVGELFSRARGFLDDFPNTQNNFYACVLEVFPRIVTSMFHLLLSKPETLPDKVLGETVALYSQILNAKDDILRRVRERRAEIPFEQFIPAIQGQLDVVISGVNSVRVKLNNNSE